MTGCRLSFRFNVLSPFVTNQLRFTKGTRLPPVKTNIRYQHLQTTPQAPMPSDSQTIFLPSGRTLGYAEYGRPTGRPLLYFHGFPASRLEAYPMHTIAARHNIRLLALDRPGFGLSTHDPERRIIDWPADVQAFAARLDLDRFAVLGGSGGGPYALACARLLPQESLTAVGVLAGATVWDRGLRTKGVPWYARLGYVMTYWPAGLRVVSNVLVAALRWIASTGWVERRVDALLEAAAKAKEAKEKKKDETRSLMTPEGTEEPQKPVLTTAERRKKLMGFLFDGFAQGTAGFVREILLLTRDWGFRFEDIAYRDVHIWHGSRDVNAPAEGMRRIAAQIPNCILKEYDENHFGMGHHLEEVLEELMGDVDNVC